MRAFWGAFGSIYWGRLGGVLEAFLWWFGKLLVSNIEEKLQIHENTLVFQLRCESFGSDGPRSIATVSITVTKTLSATLRTLPVR